MKKEGLEEWRSRGESRSTLPFPGGGGKRRGNEAEVGSCSGEQGWIQEGHIELGLASRENLCTLSWTFGEAGLEEGRPNRVQGLRHAQNQ